MSESNVLPEPRWVAARRERVAHLRLRLKEAEEDLARAKATLAARATAPPSQRELTRRERERRRQEREQALATRRAETHRLMVEQGTASDEYDGSQDWKPAGTK